MQKWAENVGNIFRVYDENIRLKQEVAELRKWQEVAALAATTSRPLRDPAATPCPTPSFPLVQARVIGQSSRPFIKTMILNAGGEQGVKAGQAVIDDRGLIGRIYITGERTSWVILLYRSEQPRAGVD